MTDTTLKRSVSARAKGGARAARSPRVSSPRVADKLLALCGDQCFSVLMRASCVGFLLSALAAYSIATFREAPPRAERASRIAKTRNPTTAFMMLASATEEGDALDSDFSLEQAALTWSHRLAEANDTPGVIRFGAVKVHQSIVERVVKAAQTTEMDPALLMAIADKESNFSTTARARTSSASGLFQFVERTWLQAVKAFGGRHGHDDAAKAIDEAAFSVAPQKRAQILNLRNDPYLSAALAAEMLKKDSAKIAEKIGRPLTPGETYLIHFLGPEDAARFMKTLEEAPETAAATLLPRPARANRPIFYEQQGGRLKVRTIGEVHEAFETMMGSRTSRYEDVATKLPAGVTAYAE